MISGLTGRRDSGQAEPFAALRIRARNALWLQSCIRFAFPALISVRGWLVYPGQQFPDLRVLMAFGDAISRLVWRLGGVHRCDGALLSLVPTVIGKGGGSALISVDTLGSCTSANTLLASPEFDGGARISFGRDPDSR